MPKVRGSREYLICQEVGEGVQETLKYLTDKSIPQKRTIWAEQMRIVELDHEFHRLNSSEELARQFDADSTTFKTTMIPSKVRLPQHIR